MVCCVIIIIRSKYESSLPFIARPFSEVQKKVAELLKDRILVGHAVFNDLRVCDLKV